MIPSAGSSACVSHLTTSLHTLIRQSWEQLAKSNSPSVNTHTHTLQYISAAKQGTCSCFMNYEDYQGWDQFGIKERTEGEEFYIQNSAAVLHFYMMSLFMSVLIFRCEKVPEKLNTKVLNLAVMWMGLQEILLLAVVLCTTWLMECSKIIHKTVKLLVIVKVH